MFASHYVIKHIYHMFDRGDVEGTQELFDKFVSRYSTDIELKRLRDEFLFYMESRDETQGEGLKKKLKYLVDARKFETSSGGTQVSSKKSRRPGINSLVRII